MVSKSNFQQNRNGYGPAIGIQLNRHSNIRATIAPYRKPPFRGGGPGGGMASNNILYSSSQMPNDSLYIDFNNPVPALPKSATVTAQSHPEMGQRRKSLKGKLPQLKGKQQTQQQQHHHHHHLMSSYPSQMNGDLNGQRFHPHPPNCYNGHMRFNRGPPNRGGGRHMMMPPHMCPGPRGMGPGPGPRSGQPYPPMPFQTPIPQMRGPLPPPILPPAFMRRNGRNHIVGGAPPMPPHGQPSMMMGPRGMPPFSGPFNMAFNGIGGKIKKPNHKLIKQVVKGKSTIKTLKNLVNQYPIDKPWVNEELLAEHNKKLDIENRLKGNKDDNLFAQFKVQRDKFVALYESARENYLKQEAASVMVAKDAKDKDKKVGNENDATIPNAKVN